MHAEDFDYNALECPVCYDEMSQPWMLHSDSGDCFHSLCKACAEGIFQHALQNDIPALCPICRVGVTRMVRNRLAENMADDLRRLEHEKTEQQRLDHECERLRQELEDSRRRRELDEVHRKQLEDSRQSMEMEEVRRKEEESSHAQRQDNEFEDVCLGPQLMPLSCRPSMCPVFNMDTFQFMERLGDSRQSNVRRAIMKTDDGEAHNVALKHCVVRKGVLLTISELYREAHIAYHLSHVNIMRMLGICHAAPNLVLVLEYYPWDAELLVLNVTSSHSAYPCLPRPLPVHLTARICLELTRALAHMHASGVAHGHLTLQAVLLTADMHVRLGCFSHVHCITAPMQARNDMTAYGVILERLVNVTAAADQCDTLHWVRACMDGVHRLQWTAMDCLGEYSHSTQAPREYIMFLDAHLFADEAIVAL